jgi:hypothetical protein
MTRGRSSLRAAALALRCRFLYSDRRQRPFFQQESKSLALERHREMPVDVQRWTLLPIFPPVIREPRIRGCAVCQVASNHGLSRSFTNSPGKLFTIHMDGIAALLDR